MALKMATAIGNGADASALGSKLAKEVKAGLGGQEAGFVMVLASIKYDHKALIQAVRAELKDVPLIGCTTAGEFTEKSVVKESVALVGLSKCEEYTFHVGMSAGLHDDTEGCVKKVIDQMPAKNSALPNRSAIMLADGLAGRGEEAVMIAMSILGSDISLSGGAAGDDLGFKQTFVFCNDQITSDSVAMCVIDSKSPVGVGSKHGHQPVTDQLTVTKAKENVLFEVDGKPAWQVWKDQLREEVKSVGIDVDALNDASQIGTFLIQYEMGLATATEYKVRVPLGRNDDDSLNFACTIPEGAKFRIMKSPKQDQIDSAEQAAKNAFEQMQGRKLAGAMIFDCVCRGLILGDEFEKGVSAMKDVFGDIPLIGFETYGEICRRTGQFSGFHNTTSVVMLLPEA